MVKIHGVVYLLVGSLVAGMSWYINNSNGNDDMLLFFWVGVIFIGIGVFKLVLRYILGVSKKDRVPPVNANYKYHQIQTANFCPACGTAVSRFDVYCRGCGRRAR